MVTELQALGFASVIGTVLSTANIPLARVIFVEKDLNFFKGQKLQVIVCAYSVCEESI